MAHVSPLSSRRRQVSPTHASLSLSFYKRHVSPIQALEVTESPEAPKISRAKAPEELESPHTPKGFRRGLSHLSLLHPYPNHAFRHVWDGEKNISWIHSL